MANILDFGGVRVLTSNAQPGAGYVAKFFVSGTTTPVTVYTDSTLGTAHGVSVEADAAGRFPAVWSSGGAIKCVIEDADAAVIQTIDPVISVTGGGDSAEDIAFTPTVDLPFTNVQEAIEGANIAGLTASAAELNLMDGFAAVESTATDVTTAFPNSRAVFRGRGWTYAPEQATTSGTAIDFTGIPSWVTEIKLIFNGVSLSSTGDLAVQLGDAGGFEATGYFAASAAMTNAGAVVAENFSTAFGVVGNSASVSYVGELILTKYTVNTWASSHSLQSGATTVVSGGGIKELSDTLTQVRLTRIGADTFDAGAVIAMWR